MIACARRGVLTEQSECVSQSERPFPSMRSRVFTVDDARLDDAPEMESIDVFFARVVIPGARRLSRGCGAECGRLPRGPVVLWVLSCLGQARRATSNSSTERAYDEGGARTGGMKCAIVFLCNVCGGRER